MSCRRSSYCCGGGMSCESLIALAIILGLGVVFYKGFNDGIFATVIVLAAIFAL
ncbi:hypothetical protein [Clostridium fermenticellae]|uniref:hypothetical protein n=1 Tax=Clostridium fermenticellae TaxID=2068654 RepID=UPI0013C42B20|nr:hypothetical protein [Clostridium fermenticellae]